MKMKMKMHDKCMCAVLKGMAAGAAVGALAGSCAAYAACEDRCGALRSAAGRACRCISRAAREAAGKLR